MTKADSPWRTKFSLFQNPITSLIKLLQIAIFGTTKLGLTYYKWFQGIAIKIMFKGIFKYLAEC